MVGRAGGGEDGIRKDLNWDPGSFLCMPWGQDVQRGEDLTKALARSGAASISTVASRRVLAGCKRLQVKTSLCEVGKIKSIIS